MINIKHTNLWRVLGFSFFHLMWTISMVISYFNQNQNFIIALAAASHLFLSWARL